MAKIRDFPSTLSPSFIEEIQTCLKEGGVLALPTESFYALCARVTHPRGIVRIRAMKGLPVEKPILTLIGDRRDVPDFIGSAPPPAEVLMEAFWPGPLTLILPVSVDISSSLLTGGTHTLGVRQPGDARVCELLKKIGPVTGTSANRSGEPPSRTSSEVQECLGEDVDIILDGGMTPGGSPSTLLSLVGEIRILRKGPITHKHLVRVLDPLGYSVSE